MGVKEESVTQIADFGLRIADWIALRALVILPLLIPVSCRCPYFDPAPVSSPAAITVTLDWSDDADLDLEFWSADPDSGGRLLRTSGAGPNGGGEIVKGGTGTELLAFTPEAAGGIVAVHFWAPGPVDDTAVTARVRLRSADGNEELFTAEIDDDSNDLWFPVAIDPSARTWRALGIYRHGGI